MDRPAPPPEAALLRLVRTASGIQAGVAAATVAARFNRKFSASRWSQIENGYEVRADEYKTVRANAATLAQMAVVVGLDPDRLESEGERADAAAILREIIRSQPAETPDDEPPPDRPGLGLAAIDPADVVRWREWVASLTEAERDLLAEAMREYPLDPVAWHLWLTPRITTAERRALVEALQTLRRGENPSQEETA